MDAILVKVFAAAIAFSQVATEQEVRTSFDPAKDSEGVAGILRSGCDRVVKAFDIETLNLDDLIATVMDDPEAVSSGTAAFRGIAIKDLHLAYLQFCKSQQVDSPIDLAPVIAFYNRTLAELPDPAHLKGFKLPSMGIVLDLKGERFSEVYEQYHRRAWLPIADIPAHVQQAFISAEDKRFYQHKGVDERAVVRAFIGNLMRSGRPHGGSTITQQVVKNLLVGEEVSFERKIREMVLAARVEQTLTKAELLELYLNSIYLGRASWGVEMAARSYFGKSASELTLPEAALLAALTRGPSYYDPDRHPVRSKERVAYVLSRLQEDGFITAEEQNTAAEAPMQLAGYERVRRGSYFVDHLFREAKAIAGIGLSDSYTVRSTLHPELQRATEAALQEGLAQYEIRAGRVQFQRAETNLSDAISGLAPTEAGKPAWQQALERATLPLYDVRWDTAVVLEKPSGPRGGTVKVGLADGRVLPMPVSPTVSRNLRVHDVVFVRVNANGKSVHAELRVRPTVQGAAVVIENGTGRVLAMTGGFSYPLSQLNRTTQSLRQPGSALKPISYLAALQKGFQPNTLVLDEAITLPPIGGGRKGEDWSPKNYDGAESGLITLRKALENSKNLATVRLLQGIDATPALSLDRICALAIDAKIYKGCERYYPFVLGAQSVRPIDLAMFYAAIANDGVRAEPYAIESIVQNGRVLFTHAPKASELTLADGVSVYQLKTMLQGVLRHGTAARMARHAPYVAGKTGTSDNENDAWFVGFTNEVTVAVWVGYDNADGKRRTLGGGRTGGNVAVPIFEPIIQAVWTHHAPRTVLNPPKPEVLRQLVRVRSNETSRGGTRNGSKDSALAEYVRRDERGRAIDAKYKLISRGVVEARAVPPRAAPRRPPQAEREPRPEQNWGFGGGWGGGWGSNWGRSNQGQRGWFGAGFN